MDTLEEQSNGLQYFNTLSEYDWENYEVSDWGEVVLIWKKDKIHRK